MNELHLSQSPYLLQHAHNPVHWRMWSQQAFDDAKTQNKPVIVSIGYATCHWCHVMEKESFEDQTIANFMNAHFVCIKVDREEMPHVDQFYMDALQSMKQSGGWPLNMFVTPDKKPFYGGTYFPPESMYNKPSWGQLLQYIHQHWTRENQDIFTQSETLTEHLQFIQKNNTEAPSHELKDIDWAWHKTAYTQHYDHEYGGWYTAPKFPQFLLLNNLVLNYRHTYDEEVLEKIHKFWANIISNGLWDSTLGGVYRYAVDQQWRIPHFEKMLYDNALIIEALSLSIRYAQMEELKPILKQQIEFVLTRMRDAETGLFYSAFDADSEGVEGLYYMLNEEEYTEFLDQNFISDLYNVEKIYHAQNGYYKINLEALITGHKTGNDYDKIREFLTQIRDQKKAHPLIDDKKILSLNALMNKALSVAYIIDFDDQLLKQIEEHFKLMVGHFKSDQDYWRIRYDHYNISAQSDDLVYLMDAAIELALLTHRQYYWGLAKDLMMCVKGNFKVENNPYLSQVSISENDIPVQRFEKIDNILPSANAIYANCLKLLGVYYADLKMIEESVVLVGANVKEMVQYPQAYAQWWWNYDFVKNGTLLKVSMPANFENLTRLQMKWGVNQVILWVKIDENLSEETDEIIIHQCFEDRCTVVFKGDCKEFEKYC